MNWLVCEIDDRSGKSVRSFLRQLVPCLAGTTPRGGEKKIELEGEVFARRNGEKELERGGRKRSGVRPPSWVSGNKSRCYIYVYTYIEVSGGRWLEAREIASHRRFGEDTERTNFGTVVNHPGSGEGREIKSFGCSKSIKHASRISPSYVDRHA